jgi:hypothetical protein
MDTTPVLRDWEHLLQFMPENMDELAKSSGAVQRWRNVKSGDEYLRLILAYVAEDLSLRTTAGWSTQNELAEMQDTSILHRLRKSIPFLELVLSHLLNHRLHGERTDGPSFCIKDATVLSIPGSRGTDWRLHATYDPQSIRLTRVEITDKHGGERLDRDQYHTDEIVIADRGLAHSKGMHAVAAADAFFLLRMHWQNIRLLDLDGTLLNMDAILARADVKDSETSVLVPLDGKPALRARLLVRPLPAAKAEIARRKLRKQARKKGRTVSATALKLAGYFCVLTTLPEELAPADVVFELYRIRWQIELFFKRAKSLLHLDRLRADDPQLVRAYILGKLIEIALISLLTTEGESFSPWGVPRRRISAPIDLAPGAFASY